MAVRIASVGVYVPQKRVTNDDLAERLGTSDDWIRSHTGIGSRHIAADDESTSDLGAEAARRALDEAGLPASSLDLIILATSSGDYLGFPSTACVLQGKLGASSAAAFDLSAGCTGFVYALETARALMEAGPYRRALVVGAEVLTRFVDWKDRSTCVLFGDGAGAFILEKAEGPGGIGQARLYADGTKADRIIMEHGGARRPFVAGEVVEDDFGLFMDGKAVYDFAVGAVCSLVEELSAGAGKAPSAFKLIVPHQANERILRAAAKRLGLPSDAFFINLGEYANTSSATIPLAIREALDKGLIERGDDVMLLAFGAGLTWGGSVVTW